MFPLNVVATAREYQFVLTPVLLSTVGGNTHGFIDLPGDNGELEPRVVPGSTSDWYRFGTVGFSLELDLNFDNPSRPFGASLARVTLAGYGRSIDCSFSANTYTSALGSNEAQALNNWLAARVGLKIPFRVEFL